jgi:D-glycero-beta-D-manno-heptose 1-phosphate adenylyltransferase
MHCNSNRKIITDYDELNERIDAARRSGKTIVFGNGCFDLIHVGHIRYLQGAKRLGDLLIVAVNDDVSVAEQGKRKQVLTPVAERIEIVAALECVDYVTVFSEPTVERLLLLLKPHIHAKGTDYSEESVPERAIVLAYGGRVAIVGDPKDHSTTELIKAIREMEASE